MTRRTKARELWRLALEGPAITIDDGVSPDTRAFIAAETKRQFELWSASRLQPLLVELIPELREQGWFAIGPNINVGPFETHDLASAYSDARTGWRVEQRP
jgi:hypothetical protein